MPGSARNRSVDAHGRRLLRVLAVDDEPPVREILTHLLESEGHRVVTAGGAREALERFHEEAFDLVITDMAMPGMSGEQLASTLKTLSPRLPIMLLTGFGAFLDPAKRRDVDVVASKPITLEELRRGIEAALNATLLDHRLTNARTAALPAVLFAGRACWRVAARADEDDPTGAAGRSSATAGTAPPSRSSTPALTLDASDGTSYPFRVQRIGSARGSAACSIWRNTPSRGPRPRCWKRSTRF